MMVLLAPYLVTLSTMLLLMIFEGVQIFYTRVVLFVRHLIMTCMSNMLGWLF